MDIAALREDVDRIDAEMLVLLNRRVETARKITAAKLEQAMPLRDNEREQRMLQAARENAPEDLHAEEAVKFRELLLAFTRGCVKRRETQPKACRIAIIGLGLIGGSLAKALKAAQPDHKLYGVDLPDRLNLPRATGLFRKLITPDEGAKAVKNADVVFLCTPLGRTLELMEALAQDVPKSATVTDVVGIKKVITQAADAAFGFPDAPYFVGGHPMAGKSEFGFAHSDATLFEGRPWILTPGPQDPVDKLNVLRGLIESTGATLNLMTSAEHDRAMAVVSHLPQLASTALMLTAGDRANGISGPALRDMTRLAASPGGMWNELCRQLKPELIGELQSFKSYLTELEMAVHFVEPLDKWFDRANALRAALEGVAEPAKPA